MPITLADVDRWDAAAIREVSTALGKRGASANEVKAGLSKLPMIATWQGSGGDAARAALDKLSANLAAHGEEMNRVSNAARSSADEIQGVKSTLHRIYDDARSEGFDVDRATGSVTPADPSMVGDPIYALQQADLEVRIKKLLAEAEGADAELARAITTGGGGSMSTAIQAVDLKQGPNMSDPTIESVEGEIGTDEASGLQPAIDPRNPFVGDERFGHWTNVVTPPYVGDAPPPPWTGHRSMEGFPGKGPAGPSGFYVFGGKTWADDNAPPAAYLQEQYRFRISGEDYTGYTRSVDGQKQQWVQYSYEAQRYTQVNIGGPAWAPTSPEEVGRVPGGVMSGGLAGITPPPKIEPWKPIMLPQISSISGANPTATFYVPDGCGGHFTFSNGVPVGGIQPPPLMPSMTAGG